MPIDINKHEVDIDTLFKQNELDLSSIKELYKKLKEMEKKISQIKYIDSNLTDKLKKDYEKLKRIIIDENIQVKLTNDINEIDISINNINNGINEIDTSINNINNDINEINSQMDNITNNYDKSNYKKDLVITQTFEISNTPKRITGVELQRYYIIIKAENDIEVGLGWGKDTTPQGVVYEQLLGGKECYITEKCAIWCKSTSNTIITVEKGVLL